MTEYVAGFLFNEDRTKVLLIQKTHPEWQRGKLNAIGGKIEPGELAADAMSREFSEEVDAPFLFHHAWLHRVTLTGPNWRVYFFVAKSKSPLALYYPKTEERLVLSSVAELDEDVVPNLRWLIPLCLDQDISSAAVIDHTFYDGGTKISLDT